MSDSTPLQPPDNYATLLSALKDRIRAARVQAALAVNRELVLLYWSIGRDILARMSAEGWGAKVVQRLAKDLRHDFPDMTGPSPRNLSYMRAFAEAYPDRQLCSRLLHNCPGGITSACSILLKPKTSAYGMRGKPSSMAGAERCSSTRSRGLWCKLL
jgi:hypothetical protein